MSKRSIVMGMGIGQLYKTVLEKMGHEVITVDPDPAKQAMYPTLLDAVREHGWFDTAHVCTPNHTHAELAQILADCSKMVFVEKPGVKSYTDWAQLAVMFKTTRMMMVKNNMWREKITGLRELVKQAKTININWINKDRVPSPGSWFTTKELAYGGVSRDLMPHLLSLFIVLEPDYFDATETGRVFEKRWSLEDLTNTEYGTVNPDGVYDVDDFCNISFHVNGKNWNLTADWRSMTEDKRNIEFIMPSGHIVGYELGLCPEQAYEDMLKECIESYTKGEFWTEHLKHDLWIHRMMEKQ